MLTWFAALSGIPATSLPSEEVMFAIIQGLIRNFGSMHEPEVRLAFEMAATDKLDVEGHYQTFSLKYLSSVLNAFRVHVNKSMTYHSRRAMPEQPSISTQTDWSESIEYLKEEVKKGNQPIIPVAVYDWMIEKEMINPSVEDKKIAMNKAHNQMKAELHSRIMGKPSGSDREDWDQINKKYSKNDKIHSKVANEAKKILVFAYLQEYVKATNTSTTADKNTNGVQ